MIRDWKKLYYPVPADEVEDEGDALLHSLRKWEGLRSETLKAFGVVPKSLDGKLCWKTLTDERRDEFPVDAESCALCNLYAKGGCRDCPLYEELGVRCDKGVNPPFTAWYLSGDPEPMLKVLRDAYRTRLLDDTEVVAPVEARRLKLKRLSRSEVEELGIAYSSQFVWFRIKEQTHRNDSLTPDDQYEWAAPNGVKLVSFHCPGVQWRKVKTTASLELYLRGSDRERDGDLLVAMTEQWAKIHEAVVAYNEAFGG